MKRIWDFFRRKHDNAESGEFDEPLEQGLLQEDQKEYLALDMSVLDDQAGLREQRVQREAEREVKDAAKSSLKKMHLIQRGRCPVCGEHLRQHLFASICESCGWHTFDTPRHGGVRVHLRHLEQPVHGDRCYVVRTGAVLVIKNDLVVAKIPQNAYDYVEYEWIDDEVKERHRNVAGRLQLLCGWCNQELDPNKEGFHLVHVAFGATQERYCFCSDDCYEAFRRTYPARVHRDCYNRNCSDCTLCIKRYGDEAEGIQTLAKDFLTVQRKRQENGADNG